MYDLYVGIRPVERNTLDYCIGRMVEWIKKDPSKIYTIRNGTHTAMKYNPPVTGTVGPDAISWTYER